MIVIPSIDIQNGSCVRLMQGDYSRVSEYSKCPSDIAAQFSNNGASYLHLVDLDGARLGAITQLDVIKSVRKNFRQKLQVGGGIRSKNDIDILFDLGIDRVVIGSSAVVNVKETKMWLDQYGSDSIVLALDFFLEGGVPYVLINGWQKRTDYTLWEILKYYPGLKNLLCTDISKDGMQVGPNFNFYKLLKTKFPNISVQASGGVSSIQDLVKLRSLNVDCAILGKAIYEEKLNLTEAMLCLR